MLGGGVTRAGEQLLEPVARRRRAQAMARQATVEIVTAALGDRVGVVGAAAIVVRAGGRRADASG